MSEKLIKKLFFNNEKIQISLQEENKKHKEGDIWEESGKKWTIKNGIKRTVSELKTLRNSIQAPLICPKCKKPMIKQKDPDIYKLFNMCMDCKIKEDTELMIKGEFDKKEQEYIYYNKLEWFKQLQEQLKDFIDQHDSDYIINQFGDIESLQKNMSKEDLTKILDKQIKEIEKILNKEKTKIK